MPVGQLEADHGETMARMTKAQQLTQEMEEEALQFFRAMLGKLPEPRRAQGIRYPLPTVVVTALMAMVCGADDAEAMQQWSEANEEWLSEFLDMPHGSPTQDVYLAVFGALNPEAFQAVFRAWAEVLALRLRASGEGKHLAVDGKTSRRSFDTASGAKAIHTVSAWLSEAGLVVGQVKTEAKSNEITAIPELLRLLDIRGATVTIDAMGCQTAIAETIIDGGGHYLLAVKENQPTLVQVFCPSRPVSPRQTTNACGPPTSSPVPMSSNSKRSTRDMAASKLAPLTSAETWSGSPRRRGGKAWTLRCGWFVSEQCSPPTKPLSKPPITLAATRRQRPKPLPTQSVGIGISRTNCTGFSTSVFEKTKRAIAPRMPLRI